MANVLPIEKQVAVIGPLAEGMSIRSIERLTGIHRDTIMRLGIRIGEGCQRLLDKMMVNLNSKRIEIDELWGFVGCKKRNLTPAKEHVGQGDAWTFVSIDPDTKVVPNFLVGKRDATTANTFVTDLASRMNNRIQLSSDALKAYVEAVEQGFGGEVDYGQIVKSYSSADPLPASSRYSPPKMVSVARHPITGEPERELISTSMIERQNLTMRMHIRRLTRLTNAFSKKLDNFKAAVALHFGYYNLVKIHNSLRMTPAMKAGVVDGLWKLPQLIEMAKVA